jgi:HAMP domain-containing protein
MPAAAAMGEEAGSAEPTHRFPLFTRIRVRILAIVLMAIIPAFALIYHSAAVRKHQISQEIEDNTIRLSRFLASNLARDLSEGRGFLNAVSQLVEAKAMPRESCSELLSGLMGNSSVFMNIGIADAGGRLLCTAKPPPPEADLADLKWFGAIVSARDYTVGFDFNGTLGKEASIVLAYPILSPAGRIGRIAFAVMNLDWLNQLAQESRLPPGSAISVTNAQGDAVARYPDPDKWVGKSYPGSAPWKNPLDGGAVRVANGIDGIRRLYAFAPVSGTGDMLVHVGIRREAIWEPAHRALKNQLLAMGAVGLFAVLAAWFASDVFLLKQVRALIEATKKLAAGRLQARSSVPYGMGELGELAKSFDEMAETLEWREAQLRESEKERTEPSGLLFEFIEMVPFPSVLLDEALVVLSGNAAAREMFPPAGTGMAGRPFTELLPGFPAEPLRNPPKGAIKASLPGRDLEIRIAKSHIAGKILLMLTVTVTGDFRSEGP